MHTVSLHPKPAALRGSRFVLGLVAAALVVSIGCASSQDQPPPPGNVTVTVSPKRAAVTTSQPQ